MVNIIVRNLPPVRETKTRSGDSGNLQWLSNYYVPGTILGTGEQTDFPQSGSSSVLGPASLPPQSSQKISASLSKKLIQACPFTVLRDCKDKKGGVFLPCVKLNDVIICHMYNMLFMVQSIDHDAWNQVIDGT